MFKNKKIISALFAVILIFSTTTVFADNEINNNVTSTSTIPNVQSSSNSDYYKAHDVSLCGNNLTVDYTVDGNLFAIGNSVTINAPIGGDAFILAKNVVIGEKAYIFSNLYVMAENVEVKGVVYGVFAFSKDFTISNNGPEKLGHIYRDLNLCAKTLNVNGRIDRNAYVNCGNIKFNTDGSDKGVIKGDLNYKAASESNFGDNLVNGKVNFTSSAIPLKKIISMYISKLGSFILFVIFIWLIYLWLAPKFLESSDKYVGKISWKILGIGLLTLLAIPLISLLLLSLNIFASISLLLIAVYIIALAISSAVFTIVANNYICKKSKTEGIGKQFGMLVLSSATVFVFMGLPFAGPIIACIVTILGLGILVSSIIYRNNKKDKKETKKSSKKSK